MGADGEDAFPGTDAGPFAAASAKALTAASGAYIARTHYRSWLAG